MFFSKTKWFSAKIWQFLTFGVSHKDKKNKTKDSRGHNIFKRFDVLPNLSLVTSETYVIINSKMVYKSWYIQFSWQSQYDS